MRQWRVGTISMGITLIGLGVLLLLSQVYNWDVLLVSTFWIPVLLVVLGIEVLVYLFLSHKEQPAVKYDVFSILFITFIGFFTIGIYVLSSTGIFTVAQQVVQAKEVEGILPPIVESIDQEIETIVIEPNNSNMTLEANNTNEINMFGTFHSNFTENVTTDSLATIHQVGDTLYIKTLQPSSGSGIWPTYTEYDLTVSIPGHVNVEVRSWINEIAINLEKIKANWDIDAAEKLSINDYKNADVEISTYISKADEERNDWEKQAATNNEKEMVKISKSFGDGDHKLTIGQVNNLNE